MPLLNVRLPGTASIFFSYLMKIASFDLIPIGNYLDEKLNMTPNPPISVNFEAIGFDSMYCLINIGSILILMVLFPILVAFDLILRLISYKYAIKANNKLKQILYWNTTLTTFKESYLIALLCAFINLRALSSETGWETLSICLTLFIIVMALAVPSLLIAIIWNNFHQLQE